jgi:hypothetical protein
MQRNWTFRLPRLGQARPSWRLLSLLLLLAGQAWPARACPGPAMRIQPVAPGVWLVPGADGDTTPGNQGAISNLLAVRDGRRLWLVGSGPTAVYAQAVRCHLQRVSGRRVTDVIAPWARPELVLGQAGLAGARRWAHTDVADAMRERCPRCLERLRLRLGSAASALAGTAVALPDHLLQGDHGRLGPLRWQRLQRAGTTAVTLWSVPRAHLTTAHGLLWADGAPDLRDADTAQLEQAWRQLAASARGGEHWLPEQGPVQAAAAPAVHLHYLQALQSTIDAAQNRGTPESDPAPALPGVSDVVNRSARHQLNWQHVWREAEARWMMETPAAPATGESDTGAQRGVFQRSLR